LEARGRQKSAVFKAQDCVLIVAQPVGEGGRAWRYLRKHPDGVGTVTFEVEDVEKAFNLLERRGGTAIQEIQRADDGQGGKLAFFSITTPFGDTTFRFVQRDGYRSLFPGMQVHPQPKGGKNRFGFTAFDHLTSNFQTMSPALLWLEHVLGFERYWGIEFHTEDVATGSDHGSGLRSTVMWTRGRGRSSPTTSPTGRSSRAPDQHLHRGPARTGCAHRARRGDIVKTTRDLRAAA
jgi:4-hydroxyphenylpyruvate dioxygenase